MSAQIYGLDGPDLLEGWTPLEAVTVLKCLADDGTVAHAIRITSDLDLIEGLGMLTAAMSMLERDIRKSFTTNGDDDD